MDENGKSDPGRVTFSYVTIAELEIIQYNTYMDHLDSI